MAGNFTSIAVFCAVDVGKSEHHGTALPADGRKTFDKPLPDNESQLREPFDRLRGKGRVLVVVDQSASIGAAAGGGCPHQRLRGGLSAGPVDATAG